MAVLKHLRWEDALCRVVMTRCLSTGVGVYILKGALQFRHLHLRQYGQSHLHKHTRHRKCYADLILRALRRVRQAFQSTQYRQRDLPIPLFESTRPYVPNTDRQANSQPARSLVSNGEWSMRSRSHIACKSAWTISTRCFDAKANFMRTRNGSGSVMHMLAN